MGYVKNSRMHINMAENAHEISNCEVCGNDKLIPILNLGAHPMCDDLVAVGDPRQCREYPIEILYCEVCRTAHQRFQVPKEELFPASYHYRSRFTADVLNGMVQLVDSCEQKFGNLAGKTVLDIGCNDGSLLDFFAKKGATTVGIEPTSAANDAQSKQHAVFADYLSEDIASQVVAAHGKPDFITFTNVFAHIENLHEVLASLKKMLARHTVIVIENHYLGAVLEGNQFDTFYHEHPRTYSYTSFVRMADTLDLSLLDVQFPSRYGGNIRVFIGNAVRDQGERSADLGELDAREGKFTADFLRLKQNVERWRAAKSKFIEEQSAKFGPLPAKAFPGRAAILVKLLDLDESKISAVYEKPGSLKIGHYVPGTRIEIRSDEEFENLPEQPAILLNFAWHISAEITSYLRNAGYEGEIVDILDTEDFS